MSSWQKRKVITDGATQEKEGDNHARMRAVLLRHLSCFLFLVEVNCQPYVSFTGSTLANNSYMDVSLVGSGFSGGDSVQCHTDLATCCSGVQGSHRGDWYFPNGTRLSFNSGIIHQTRTAQRVDLHRKSSAILPSGMYRCDIPTLSFHYESDNTVRDTVYVGIYTPVGGQQTSTAFFLY